MTQALKRIASILLCTLLLAGLLPAAGVLAAQPAGIEADAAPALAESPCFTSLQIQYKGKRYTAKGLGNYDLNTVGNQAVKSFTASFGLPGNLNYKTFLSGAKFIFAVDKVNPNMVIADENGRILARSGDASFKIKAADYPGGLPVLYVGRAAQLNVKRTRYTLNIPFASGVTTVDEHETLSLTDTANDIYTLTTNAKNSKYNDGTVTKSGDTMVYHFRTGGAGTRYSLNATGSKTNYSLTAVYEGSTPGGADVRFGNKTYTFGADTAFLLEYTNTVNPSVITYQKVIVRVSTARSDDTSFQLGFRRNAGTGGSNLAFTALNGDDAFSEGWRQDTTKAEAFNTYVLNNPDVNLQELYPVFKVGSGATVRVGNVVLTSGKSVVNFYNGPVTFLVTSQTGKTQKYTVTVTKKTGGAKLVVAGGANRTVDMGTGVNSYDIQVMNVGGKTLSSLRATLSDTKNFTLDNYYTLGGTSNYQLRPYGDEGNASNYGSDYCSGYVRIVPNSATKSGTYKLKVTLRAKGARVVQNLTIKYKKDKDFSVDVDSVLLNKGDTTLLKGRSLKVAATVLPANAKTKAVTWHSSKTAVATVDANGRITARGNGQAVITAASGGKKTSIKIFVGKKVSKVTLPAAAQVARGATKRLKPAIKPSGAANKAVYYTTSNPQVATVNKKGYVTGKTPGTAVITVYTIDGAKKARCVVTVS